jgi:hypothetical protein
MLGVITVLYVSILTYIQPGSQVDQEGHARDT